MMHLVLLHWCYPHTKGRNLPDMQNQNIKSTNYPGLFEAGPDIIGWGQGFDGQLLALIHILSNHRLKGS